MEQSSPSGGQVNSQDEPQFYAFPIRINEKRERVRPGRGGGQGDSSNLTLHPYDLTQLMRNFLEEVLHPQSKTIAFVTVSHVPSDQLSQLIILLTVRSLV